MKKKTLRLVRCGISQSRSGLFLKSPKCVFLLVTLTALAGGLSAQTEFPAGDFWSLDMGLGMGDILVDGTSFQLVVDPKLWLSPALMVGSRIGVNYALEGREDPNTGTDAILSDILTFEGQVYLRWNFLRLGQNVNKKVNIFAQAGLGLLSSYRGDSNPFDNPKKTRGSLLADAALGVTIPLTERWHIEAQARGGYPHLWGASITAGYKFRLPEKTKYIESEPQIQYEYREVIKTLPPNEIIKRIMITSVEFILFGPNLGKYNTGVDPDARELNELVLNQTAAFLKEHPECRVRIEGHANPVTADPKEADELMTLSTLRANTVAEQLKARGITDEQMIIIAFGGTRTLTSEHAKWDRNRRVEMIMIQVDADQN